jgi:hypothetical protein
LEILIFDSRIGSMYYAICVISFICPSYSLNAVTVV